MSPFLASARTFNTLAFLLAKLYYKNLLSSSKASDSDVLYREKTAYREKKKKRGQRGTAPKGRHQQYSLKERVSPLGHPSLPQSHCMYRRRRLLNLPRIASHTQQNQLSYNQRSELSEPGISLGKKQLLDFSVMPTAWHQHHHH